MWKLQFKNCLCDSQAFGVYSSAIENSGSQGRTVLRVSNVKGLLVDYWTVRFSGESCASSFKCLKFVHRLLDCSVLGESCASSCKCLKFVHRLLDCSVLRGELCFVFQVCSSIIGLFGSQERTVLRLSSV